MRIPDELPWQATGNTLGSGGQGEVQIVTHETDPQGQKYALKVLRNAGARQARQRFRREIEAIKNLTSSVIVKVIDHSNEDAPFQFYVMEYHEGAKTLDSIITSTTNPYRGNVTMSLGLFEQVISAIAECQAAVPPIVHRDINPQNILVLPDNSIRLIDFGICQVQDGTMITLVDENVGARNYTSPECEAGNDNSIRVNSDIYSAAKVLWSAITSSRAFAREAPVFNDKSMERIFPTRPETWHLSHIFERTIRENQSDRVQGISETLDAIREVQYLIEMGFPPLQEVASRCPSCGLKTVGDYLEGYGMIGNSMPRGLVSLICGSCGFWFVRNTELLKNNIGRLEGLN